jgi:hypothetical protein
MVAVSKFNSPVCQQPECPAASAIRWLRTSQSREFSLCLAGNLSRPAAAAFVVKSFVQTALTVTVAAGSDGIIFNMHHARGGFQCASVVQHQQSGGTPEDFYGQFPFA